MITSIEHPTGAPVGSLCPLGRRASSFQVSLTAGVAEVALQDTANSSAFSDAVDVTVFQIKGAPPIEGITLGKQDYEIPSTRFGAPNTKFRFNVLSISGGGTLSALGWLEQ